MPEILEATIAEPVAENLERATRKEEEDRIVEEAIRMRDFIYYSRGVDEMPKAHNRLTAIINELEERHKGPERAYLPYVISGRTTERDKYAYFDYTGEDSIVTILKRLVDEYDEYKAE